MSKKYKWLDFSHSYFSFAQLGCEELIEHKYTWSWSDISKDPPILGSQKKFPTYTKEHLLIPVLYNIKHGIEIYTKTLMKILDIDSPKEHDSKKLFNQIKIVISKGGIKSLFERAYKDNSADSNLELALKEVNDILSHRVAVEHFIMKYQRLEILKGKLDENYVIDDDQNTAFRYPENRLKLVLDYNAILSRITDDDLEELLNDVKSIWSNFNSLGFILAIYSEYKAKGY